MIETSSNGLAHTPPLKTLKVFAAMCVHRGVQVRTLKMMRFFERCPNPRIEFHIYEGDALIDRARGRAATDFLRTDCDVLFFLDDDVFFYDETQIRQLCRLAEQDGFDVVGAAYSIKDEQEPVFAIRTLEDQGEYTFGKDGGVFEVRYVSSGCMAIKRRVFEEMVEHEMVHLCNPDTLRFYPFFTPGEKILNGSWIYLSEDWNFCEKAKYLGFRIWVDSTVKLGHIGPKVYDWDDFVRPKKEVHENLLYKVDVQKQ